MTAKENKDDHLASFDTNELMIAFDSIDEISVVDESALVEIKDNKLIGRINNAVPELLKISGQTSSARKFVKAVKEAGTLYEAIIPTGAKLAQSKDMEGAVRGFYHGAKGINGHANIKPFDKKTIDKLVNSNITSAAMNAASMVVGQYYMSQISHQLGAISDRLDNIAAFQENKLKSKIYALIVEVRKSSEFQIETIENEEQRKRELDKLSSFEHECAQLLGQANLTIKDFEGKETDYSKYEKKISKANTWYMYQQLLLKIMMEIDELTYVFSFGMTSKEKCYKLFSVYEKQSDDAIQSLAVWHKQNIEAFEIDLDESKRKKQGWDRVLAWLPSLFDNSLQYTNLPSNIIEVIRHHQSSSALLESRIGNDLFHQNVHLIIKDGNMYYLPEKRDNHCEE